MNEKRQGLKEREKYNAKKPIVKQQLLKSKTDISIFIEKKDHNKNVY